MATIVNNPGTTQESDKGSGFLIGTVLIIAFILLMFYFGLPMLQNAAPNQAPNIIQNQTEPNNQAPAAQDQPPAAQDQPDINIPDKIDVNVDQQPNTQ